jgi:hypothetical protein
MANSENDARESAGKGSLEKTVTPTSKRDNHDGALLFMPQGAQVPASLIIQK